MLNITVRNSIIGKVIKSLLAGCRYCERMTEGFFKDSWLNNRAKAAGKLVKRYSEQSFLLKTILGWTSPILDIRDSKIINFASSFELSMKKKLTAWRADSGMAAFIDLVRADFRTDPFKAIGVIIFTAVLTKIIISIVTRSHADPLGRLIEILFLLLGASCMCEKNIKETSHFIKFFNI